MGKDKGCFAAIIQVAQHFYIRIPPSILSTTRFLLTI